MAQITEKELSALGDLLGFEQVVVAKYKEAEKNATDTALAACFAEMAQRHQRHFDELYTNLK